MQVKRGRMEKAEKNDSLYNPGKLFIGGLSWETTTEKLTNHFKKYGEIIDSVIMKDKETGHPRGFGFVTYSDASVIDKVLNEQHVLNGRIADVKKTVPRDKMVKGPKTKKIFVGGLPLTLKEEELKDYFSQFGKVVEHPIMLDKKNGNSRGFGFIVFDSEQAVENALSQGNYHQIAGKQVEIKKAEPKKSTEDVPPPPFHGPSQGRGAPGFSAGPYGRFGESYNSDFDSGFGPFGVGNYGSSGRYPDTGSYGVSAYGDRYKGSPLGGYSSGFGSYTGIGGSGPGGYDDIGRGGSNLGGYGDVGRGGGGPGGYGDVGRGGSSLGGYGDLGRGGVGLGGYGDLGRGGSLGGYGDGREGNSLGGNGDGKGSRLGGYGDIGRGGSYLGIGGGVGFGGGYSPSGGAYGSSSNVGLNRSGRYGEPGGNARYHPYGRS